MASNSSVSVTCDACGETTLIPEFFIGANCQSRKCSSSVLLKPVKDGNKYVRIICHEQIHYTSVAKESKSTKCACCQEDFMILDTIVEVRCGQKVYCARRKVPVEEQLHSVKSDLAKNNEQNETQKGPSDLKKEHVNELGEIMKSVGVPIATNENKKDKAKKSNGPTNCVEARLKALDARRQRLWETSQEKRRHEEAKKASREMDVTDELKEILSSCGVDVEEMNKNYEEDAKEDGKSKKIVDEKVVDEKDNELSLAEYNMLKKCVWQKIDEEDSMKMGDLKSENCSLLKKIAELEEQVKGNSENRLQEQNDLKNEIIDLNRENNRLNAKILEDAINIAEMKKNLEIYASEKHQLLNKLATVNALYQSASITGNRMVEQINTLMVSNLNLTETVKKIIGDAPQKNADEQEMEEAQEPKEEQEKEDEKEGPLTIPCTVCGVNATLEKDAWMTHCKETGCQGNTSLILAPVKEGHRIVRRVCKNVVTFSLVPVSQKALQCSCCKRGFIITDVVIEVRNEQKIFKADVMVLPEDELQELKEKLKQMKESLKTVEEEHDCKVNALECEILDMEKKHLEATISLRAEINSKDEALKILQKDLTDAMFLIHVHERDIKAKTSNSVPENDSENLAKNLLTYQNSRLTEINKMLMEKLRNAGDV